MAKAAPAQDAETTEVKNVQIFCNGNRFAPPRHVVVNTRQVRNFDTFLDELTRILNPLQGAIRRLYTPVSGNTVEDTKELQEGGGYVAAGKEKFKKLNYFEIQSISPRRTHGPKFPYFDIKPVTHSQFRVSGKVKKINIQSKKIVVFPNGHYFLPPSIIVLNQTEQTSMDTVMHSVGIKVDLPHGGCPERLYTLDGDRIDHTDKVTNGTMYVAASHREKFKPGPYGPYTRMGPLKFPLRLTPLNRKKYEAKGSDSEQSQENSTSSDYSSSKRSRKSRATVRENENGVFHVQQARRKKSPEKAPLKQPDYDRDQGGIFKAKAKNPETRHANAVSENADTKVEVPVDNMAAEQINEEKFSDRESPSKNTSIKKSEKEHKKTDDTSSNQRSQNTKNDDIPSNKKTTENNGESARNQISGQAAPEEGAGNSTSSSKDIDKKNSTQVEKENDTKPVQAANEPKNSKTLGKSEESLVDTYASTPPPDQSFSHGESNKQVGDGGLSDSSKSFNNGNEAAQNGGAKVNADRAESPKAESKDSKVETDNSKTKADDQRISDNATLNKETPRSEPNVVEKDPFESSVSPDGRRSSLSNKSTKNDDNPNDKQPEKEGNNKNAQDDIRTSGDKQNMNDKEEPAKPSDQEEREVLNSPLIESSVDLERTPSVQTQQLSESLTSDQFLEIKSQDSINEVPKDDRNALNSSQDMNNVADKQQNEHHNTTTGNSKELEKQSSSIADEKNAPKVPASTNG